MTSVEYDHGARRYRPALLGFSQPDAMAESYPWFNPYLYCAANPVNLADPSGNSPVYSTEGEFLGTDDNGLQGELIVVNKDDYYDNMSPDKLKEVSVSVSSLDKNVFEKIKEHFSTLPSRPDYDGYITLEEANDWYRNGDGKPLYADLRKIDLSGIQSLGENYVGEEGVFNLLLCSNSLNDGLVYGNIKLKRYPNNAVRAYADVYDFDIKSWKSPGNWLRNIETMIGAKVAGSGRPYTIFLYGTAQLQPIMPWVK